MLFFQCNDYVSARFLLLSPPDEHYQNIHRDDTCQEYGDKQGQSTSATNKVMAWEQVRDRLLSEGTADEPAVHAVAG